MTVTSCSTENCTKSVDSRGMCHACYERARRNGLISITIIKDDVLRFYSKVKKTDDGCWIWVGSSWDGGYGRMSVKGKSVLAHRFSYSLLVGEIPEGKQLDHLCRNRGCVNPEHLEPVSAQENQLRGNTFTARNSKVTHCRQGHPYSGENLYLTPDGRRDCRTCRRAANAKQSAKRKAGVS